MTSSRAADVAKSESKPSDVPEQVMTIVEHSQANSNDLGANFKPVPEQIHSD